MSRHLRLVTKNEPSGDFVDPCRVIAKLTHGSVHPRCLFLPQEGQALQATLHDRTLSRVRMHNIVEELYRLHTLRPTDLVFQSGERLETWRRVQYAQYVVLASTPQTDHDQVYDENLCSMQIARMLRVLDHQMDIVERPSRNVCRRSFLRACVAAFFIAEPLRLTG